MRHLLGPRFKTFQQVQQQLLGSKYVMFSTIKSPHPQAIISFLIHYNTIIPLITIKYIHPTLWLIIIVFLYF